ncbi:glutathione S-transferase family protein [Rhodoferax saidenbachensis]|uniref:Glutathione S-transferase n=1 Tax=Rhodoferax saidenbachensis TaxID=1484693 RepID=A0A1P8KEU1_9BURK|nr:glutathione S-transferase family protein [Rhodoferax saidenbachensis]APW44557.1 glutathione S-transferase [Rhodoferax saidenbachensis]
MQLYSSALSLFSRKVEIALAEKGLAFDRVMVPFTQTVGYSPKHPEVLAINPKGQVPVLIDGDLKLYDSTVILEYLEDAYPTPALYHASPGGRAQCRLWDVYADEILLAPVRALMHRTGPRPADPQCWLDLEAAAEVAKGQIAQHFTHIDQQLAGKAYLCGTFSVADIAMFVTVLYSQRLGGPSIKGHAALHAWYSGLELRAAFARVVDEIAAADRALSVPVDGAYA